MSTNETFTLPSSPETEQAVLGLILLDPEKIALLSQFLSVGDFYMESHRTILRAMLKLFSERTPIDIFTLQHSLGEKLESIGGAAYLASLTDGLPRRSNLPYYCRIVREGSLKRQLLRIAAQIETNSRENMASTTIASEAALQLHEINHQASIEATTEIGTSYLQVVEDLRNISKSSSGRMGFSTGVSGLDRQTTGIRDAEYWVIAGRSGQGKSTMMLQSAWTNAREGIRSLICSTEMTRSQLLLRLLSWETQIPFYRLRDPRWISTLEWSSIANAQTAIEKLPLVVDESSGLTGDQWEARIYTQIHQGARVVYFDYLQRIFEPQQKSLYEKTTAASARFREISKQTKIPVVMVSQLRRPEGSLDTSPPTIYELKESGNIENDAHTVILIHRPTKQGKYTHEDIIAIGKQRSGPSGVFIPAFFDEEHLQFMDREKGNLNENR